MSLRNVLLFLGLFACMMICQAQSSNSTQPENKKKMDNTRPHVLISTSMGDIEIELYPDKAPISVKNFLVYVNEKFYTNTIFHRVIYNFMIQGGGLTANFQEKQTHPPIAYEGNNGLSNLRGTIAYARTMDPNSATCQFFINHRDNGRLDHGKTQDGFGYTVFGKVVRGIECIDKIAAVQTSTGPQGMRDVPVNTVVINSICVLD